MDNKSFENIIDMTDIETKRTYVKSNGEHIEVKDFNGLIVHKDNSHTIVHNDKNRTDIESDWLVFFSETPVGDFSFNVVEDTSYEALETWLCLQGIEKTRTYTFKELEYTIKKPSKVYVKKSGSHKVVDEDGVIHYISSSFINVSSIR